MVFVAKVVTIWRGNAAAAGRDILFDWNTAESNDFWSILQIDESFIQLCTLHYL